MESIIQTYTNGEMLVLTTNSPASHYGIPALRYSGCDCPDMGPSDGLCLHVYPPALIDFFGPRTAAEAVKAAHVPARETHEAWDPDAQGWIYTTHDPAPDMRRAINAFLAQSPDGSQV